MVEKLGYKHLETDEEFRKRLLDDLGLNARYWRDDLNAVSGERLDNFAWGCFTKQRRIVEVFP